MKKDTHRLLIIGRFSKILMELCRVPNHNTVSEFRNNYRLLFAIICNITGLKQN